METMEIELFHFNFSERLISRKQGKYSTILVYPVLKYLIGKIISCFKLVSADPIFQKCGIRNTAYPAVQQLSLKSIHIATGNFETLIGGCVWSSLSRLHTLHFIFAKLTALNYLITWASTRYYLCNMFLAKMNSLQLLALNFFAQVVVLGLFCFFALWRVLNIFRSP